MNTVTRFLLILTFALLAGCTTAVLPLPQGNAGDPCAPEAPSIEVSDVLKEDADAPRVSTSASEMPSGHHMHGHMNGMSMDHEEGMKMDGESK